MQYRLLIFAVISVLLVSCKHTVVEETWPNGNPKRVCVYSGKGESRELLRETTYYENKQVMITGEFKNGKREGHWASFYQDGTKWSEANYVNGLRDGRNVTYFENGKIRYEGTFRQDNRAGMWRFYDETGKLLQEVQY